MSMPTMKLAECCEVVAGATPKTAVDAYWGGDILWATPKDISRLDSGVLTDTPDKITTEGFKSCSTRMLPVGAVLVSSRAPIGLVAVVGKELCTNQGFKSLIPGPDVHSGYLYHCMKAHADRLAALGNGATFKEVSKSVVENFEIPLPTIPEQKRIAAILDKSDSLRRKRQEVIRLADDLLRSTLLTCLEQPYDALVVEQLLSVKKNAIRTGPFGSQLLHAEFTESGVPVLGIDNVVTNRFRWDERRYVSADKYEQLSRYTVYPGDVMVTIMGTTGRVAVAPDNLPICISTKHLCTMTVDRTKILPEFLWACLLWDPAVRAQSSRESKGAIMDGLNMGIVKGLLIKVPSMDVQQRFVSVLRKVDALRSKYKVAVDDGASLNAALISKLLGGSSQH